MDFNLKQKISAWCFAIVWALSLGLSYLISSYDDKWSMTQFAQCTIFWGVFAFLTHVSLKSKKKPD